MAALEREPVLVVPTVDDVYRLRARALRGGGALLGAGVTTFDRPLPAVATAGGAPPGAELTRAQRLRRRLRCGRRRARPARAAAPLRGAPGFAVAFERLLEELQAAGRGRPPM